MAKKPPSEQFESHRKVVALNVLRLRRGLEWSQEQLAEQADIDRTTLARLETRYINITLDTLFALAEVLGVSAHELLMESDEDEP